MIYRIYDFPSWRVNAKINALIEENVKKFDKSRFDIFDEFHY